MALVQRFNFFSQDEISGFRLRGQDTYALDMLRTWLYAVRCFCEDEKNSERAIAIRQRTIGLCICSMFPETREMAQKQLHELKTELIKVYPIYTLGQRLAADFAVSQPAVVKFLTHALQSSHLFEENIISIITAYGDVWVMFVLPPDLLEYCTSRDVL